MLLDEYLPDYHFSEKHTIDIKAMDSQVFQAILDVSPGEISFLFKCLFYIRFIPAKIFGEPNIGFDPDSPLLRQMEENGFTILGTNDRELVFGFVGQFWKIKGEPAYKINDLNDFINFNEKDSGKAAANFYMTESEDKVTLSTETRVYLCDRKARIKFSLYWMIIHPGSALIRRIWLKAIKKRAEKNTGKA